MDHRTTAWVHAQLAKILASYEVKGFITVPVLKFAFWIITHKLRAHERLSGQYYGADGWLRNKDGRVY